jgi:hypothetical protein
MVNESPFIKLITWVRILIAVLLLVWIGTQIYWGIAYIPMKFGGIDIERFNQHPYVFLSIIALYLLLIWIDLKVVWNKIRQQKQMTINIKT